jgi:hypothetical protein
MYTDVESDKLEEPPVIYHPFKVGLYENENGKDETMRNRGLDQRNGSRVEK